jgi:hypothetical protein
MAMDHGPRLTLIAAAAACLALATTACTKSSAGPSVAQLTTPASSAGSSPAGGPDTAPANRSSPPKGAAGLLAYSQCMRSHGVPDFPDPVGDTLQLKASQGSDLDPNSPQFVAAQKACTSLQPGGGKAGTVSAAQQAEALKYSACMRSHGLPSFPDPVFSGGGVQLKVTNIDPNSPQFVAAQKACQSLQPGRGGGLSVGQSDQGAAGGGGTQTEGSGS